MGAAAADRLSDSALNRHDPAKEINPHGHVTLEAAVCAAKQGSRQCRVTDSEAPSNDTSS